MSKIYLAARFGRRFELRTYREDLEKAGHFVTSRWLDIVAENDNPAAQAHCAEIDMQDLKAADTLIAFTENLVERI